MFLRHGDHLCTVAQWVGNTNNDVLLVWVWSSCGRYTFESCGRHTFRLYGGIVYSPPLKARAWAAAKNWTTVDEQEGLADSNEL